MDHCQPVKAMPKSSSMLPTGVQESRELLQGGERFLGFDDGRRVRVGAARAGVGHNRRPGGQFLISD